MGQAFGGLHSTDIETIETLAKLKICFKISPKFDGVPAIVFLPIAQLAENVIYNAYNTCFLK